MFGVGRLMMASAGLVTTPWTSPSAATTVALSGSSVNFNNPNNALLADASYASTNSIGSIGQYSNYLVLTNFGFSLPSGAVPKGIEVRYLCASGNANAVQDHSIRLYNAGVTGNNNAQAVDWDVFGSAGFQTRGGAADLWGLTPSESDVEGANFGIAISGKRTGAGSVGLQVDHVEMRIHYL